MIPPDGGAPVQCNVVWVLDHLSYQAECSLPKLDQAGEWQLEVSLDGTTIADRTLRMQCPPGEFEDKDTKCKGCPVGADCSEPGVALATMPVKSGYWRANSESHNVLECFLGEKACGGGSGNSTN